MQFIDYSLNSFKVPGLEEFNHPFGDKKDTGRGLSTLEITQNEMMPFMKQRPISGVFNSPDGVIREDSYVTTIQFDATFAVASGVTLQLADPSYEGQVIRIVGSFNKGEPPANISLANDGSNMQLLDGEKILSLYAVNNKWSIKNIFLGLSPSNPIEVYPQSWFSLDNYTQEGFYNFHIINPGHIGDLWWQEMIESDFTLAIYKCGNHLIREITYLKENASYTYVTKTIRQNITPNGQGVWELVSSGWESLEFTSYGGSFGANVIGILSIRINRSLRLLEVEMECKIRIYEESFPYDEEGTLVGFISDCDFQLNNIPVFSGYILAGSLMETNVGNKKLFRFSIRPDGNVYLKANDQYDVDCFAYYGMYSPVFYTKVTAPYSEV